MEATMRSFFVALFASLFAPCGVAQEITPPDELVKSVTQDVVAIVKQDKDIRAGNTKKTVALVEEKALRHFKFTRMTALGMGPSGRKASPEQQRLIVEQFRTLLVRTYSTAISSYRDQAIEFKPPRSPGADKDTVVRSVVRQPGAEPVSIDYSMEKTPH